jgi:hypothetical protein
MNSALSRREMTISIALAAQSSSQDRNLERKCPQGLAYCFALDSSDFDAGLYN